MLAAVRASPRGAAFPPNIAWTARGFEEQDSDAEDRDSEASADAEGDDERGGPALSAAAPAARADKGARRRNTRGSSLPPVQ